MFNPLWGRLLSGVLGQILVGWTKMLTWKHLNWESDAGQVCFFFLMSHQADVFFRLVCFIHNLVNYLLLLLCCASEMKMIFITCVISFFSYDYRVFENLMDVVLSWKLASLHIFLIVLGQFLMKPGSLNTQLQMLFWGDFISFSVSLWDL